MSTTLPEEYIESKGLSAEQVLMVFDQLMTWLEGACTSGWQRR
jgi:hypothetical protein